MTFNSNIVGDTASKIVHIPFIFLATVFLTGFVAAINGPNVRSVLQVRAYFSRILCEAFYFKNLCLILKIVTCVTRM